MSYKYLVLYFYESSMSYSIFNSPEEAYMSASKEKINNTRIFEGREINILPSVGVKVIEKEEESFNTKGK